MATDGRCTLRLALSVIGVTLCLICIFSHYGYGVKRLFQSAKHRTRHNIPGRMCLASDI